MKQIFVSGTLGDSYSVGLKLMNKKENFEILHHTNHKFWYKSIFDIYSLFPNIKNVTFVEFLYPDIKEMSGLPEPDMVWFPDLEPPYIPMCNERYIVIFPHTGREDAMARKIPIKTVERMVELLAPTPVVILGTDKRYKNIKCHANLIGETTIKDAISIIISSSGYSGPEGLPAFVALSHKIPSVIFWVRWQPVEARLLNNPWTDHIVDLIKL